MNYLKISKNEIYTSKISENIIDVLKKNMMHA